MKNRKTVFAVFIMAVAFGIFAAGCSSSKDSSGSGEGLEAEEGVQTGENESLGLKSFEADTLDGGTFTQDDLSEKDVTLINFWALTCGPCVEEMPDISEFAKSLPDNIQIITVCLDGRGDEEAVQNILDSAGYQGITLLDGNGDFTKISSAIQYTPTTILVDKEGNIIADPVIGGQEDLAGTYTDIINTALSSMGKAEIGNEEK